MASLPFTFFFLINSLRSTRDITSMISSYATSLRRTSNTRPTMSMMPDCQCPAGHRAPSSWGYMTVPWTFWRMSLSGGSLAVGKGCEFCRISIHTPQSTPHFAVQFSHHAMTTLLRKHMTCWQQRDLYSNPVWILGCFLRNQWLLSVPGRPRDCIRPWLLSGLLLKPLCLVWVSVYPTVLEQLKIFNYVTAIWQDNRKRTMSESLDIQETYDFVWGFLGWKIFPDVQDFWSWTENEGASFELGQVSESESWDFFVKFMLQYLRPPNVIELLLLWAWDGSWPPNQPYYLWQLGHSDKMEGVVLVHNIGLSPDTSYSVASIEADALQRVRELDSRFHTNVTDTFKRYWETRWASNARSRVFTWEEQDNWIIERVMAGDPWTKDVCLMDSDGLDLLFC